MSQQDSEKSEIYYFDSVPDNYDARASAPVAPSADISSQPYRSLSGIDDDFHIIEDLEIPIHGKDGQLLSQIYIFYSSN